MPMLDAYIPEGALSADAERRLLADLTDILIVHEGADPSDPRVQASSWVVLHRPAEIFVAGTPAEAPRYRLVCSAPEGVFDDERREAIVAAVTARVMEAEDGAHPRDPRRVWVFPNEIPDGTWGSGGRIVTLADLATATLGDRTAGERHAADRLAISRHAS